MIIQELKRAVKFLEGKRAKAEELEFISRIARDGSGVEPVTKEQQERLQNQPFDEEYTLNRLSLTEDTYIASGTNSYVVRKKEDS